ncbi:MAG TPA: sulfatase/phosphatase domain-containing protein, partial [Candidatus Binatia bacterium]|nr:sulfatase/phosphatase domain-containing protein [Candidatus Binatia bacterium]
EELGEHGRLGHEKTLFEEVVRVPLVVVGPGVGRGDVDRVVSLVDVAPTVLAAAGVSRPAPFEGASLADLLPATGLRSRLRRTFGAARDEGPEPVAYTELLKTAARDERRVSPHERALVTRARKLIVGVNGEREFYRLDRDPGEKDPAGLDAPERRRLEARLEAVRLAAERDRAPAEAQPLDAATRERLRALGYAGN